MTYRQRLGSLARQLQPLERVLRYDDTACSVIRMMVKASTPDSPSLVSIVWRRECSTKSAGKIGGVCLQLFARINIGVVDQSNLPGYSSFIRRQPGSRVIDLYFFTMHRRWLCFAEHAPLRDDSPLALPWSFRCRLARFLPSRPAPAFW